MATTNAEDFLPVQILRAHEWRPIVAECRCGWTQKENIGGRRATKLNHPHHVAGMLREAGVLNGGAQ